MWIFFRLAVVDIVDKYILNWYTRGKPVNKAVNILFLSVLLFFVFLSTPNNQYSKASVIDSNRSIPITIFLVDGLSVDRLLHWMSKHPAFDRWIKSSDFGVMTMRTAGNRSVQNQLLTLSTGIKSIGQANLLEAIQLKDDGVIQIPYYREWLSSNQDRIKLTIGEALQRAGRTVEVIGSGDLGYQTRRLAPLFSSDLQGMVSKGYVEDLLLHESLLDPLFYISNYEQIKQGIFQSDADLLVVELGDLRRLFNTGKRIPIAERDLIREEVEDKIMNLLLWAQAQYSESRELWLLSPGIDPITEKRMEWMTPLVRHVPGERSEAVFRSPTTRQPGIVANVDIFPTLLQHWNIDVPPQLEGSALERLVDRGLQKELIEQTKKIFYIHKMRPDLLYQVISLQVILLVLIGLISMLVPKRSMAILQIGHYLLIYVLMVPFFLLLHGAYTPSWKLWQLHLYLFIGGALTGFLLRNKKKESIYVWICSLYVFILLFDGLLNNVMMKRSFLGYDPVIGARYYGIGNEYMGVLIGSGLLLFYLLYERMRTWKRLNRGLLLFLFMLLILYYLAIPGGGTNAGGTIAWMVAILFSTQLLLPEFWVGRRISYLLLGLLMLFLLFLFVQFIQPGTEQTHIGRLLHHISVGGSDSFFETVKRKWEMNWRLIKVSTWSKLFVTSLVVLGWFLLLPKRRRRKEEKEVFWSKAFRTIVWVSLVNLLVNDSGVVAAALSLLFAAVPLLNLVLYERTNSLLAQ